MKLPRLGGVDGRIVPGGYGRSVKIVVQQRTHEEDISGYLLANAKEEWFTLILPNEFEENRKSITVIDGKKFWEDPRKKRWRIFIRNYYR